MLRIFISVLITMASLSEAVAAEKRVEFIRPFKELFSHKKHDAVFSRTNVSCTDCHSFSVKPLTSDPLSAGVTQKLLAPNRNVCHQCHIGHVNVPKPNECTVCHTNTRDLLPESHNLNWKARHGTFAQMDPDSCRTCHSEKTCSKCHTQRDVSKPRVHKPNFRFTHSIQARSNPQSCVSCHSSASFCVQCHSKGLKK